MNSQPGLEPAHLHKRSPLPTMKDRVESAFLSFVPLEPVLVFSSDVDSQAFRNLCSGGRIYHEHPKWVFMPMPQGLLRVRTAQRGDIAVEFESARAAQAWNDAIKNVGTIERSSSRRPDWDRTVYLGKILRP